MGLFKPAWQSDNKEKAIKAISKITDPTKLAEIVNYLNHHSSEWLVKHQAQNQLQCFCEHSWNGCVCNICDKTRDEQHNWNGCKCSRCGKTRDEQHDWDSKKSRCKVCDKKCSHTWDGCICSICGATAFHADREKHDWRYEADDCRAKCTKCGRTEIIHDRDHCICRRCGEIESVWGKSHVWEEIPGQCKIKCTVCGGEREDYDKHVWEEIPARVHGDVSLDTRPHENNREVTRRMQNLSLGSRTIQYRC